MATPNGTRDEKVDRILTAIQHPNTPDNFDTLDNKIKELANEVIDLIIAILDKNSEKWGGMLYEMKQLTQIDLEEISKIATRWLIFLLQDRPEYLNLLSIWLSWTFEEYLNDLGDEDFGRLALYIVEWDFTKKPPVITGE